MVDDPQQRTGEAGEGLLLGMTSVKQTLVADTPFGSAPRRDEGGEIAGMTPGARRPDPAWTGVAAQRRRRSGACADPDRRSRPPRRRAQTQRPLPLPPRPSRPPPAH